MLASGEPSNPDGKLATWALNGLAWSIVPLCILLLCVIGRRSFYIRGTGGPPVVGGLSTALSYGVYLNSLTTLVHRIAGSERSVEHQKHCIQLGHKGLVKEFGVPHVFRNLCEQHADQIPRAVR